MKLDEALRILGFESHNELPKLKDIQKQFHRLCKEKHPDKNNGSKESTAAFQILLDAYHTAGKAAEKVAPENDDIDDIIARKVFKQFQFSSVKVNSQSVTIKTEKSLNATWLDVLTSNLGDPVSTKDIHGKKFTFVDSCEEPSTCVYLTLYHTGNLLVQAQGNKQSINIHFIDSHLRDLFIQVYKRAKQLEKQSGYQSHKTSLRKLTKNNKNPLKKIKCPKCDYITNITSHLAKHMKKVHGNSVARKLSISFDESPSSSADPFSAISTLHCRLCGSDFDTESEMSNHIKSVHEITCPLCSKILYDKFDLDMHMNTHTTPEDIKCKFCGSNFLTDADLRLHLATHQTKNDKNKDDNKTLAQELVEIGEIPLLQNHPDVLQVTLSNCATCKVSFGDDEDLRVHMEKDHETMIPYKCDKCNFTTAEAVVFKHHTLLMHVPGFECIECKKIIFPDDNVICCSNCDYFFHKHCTSYVQAIETENAWCCHNCLPKSSEDVALQPNTCYLCHFQAGNEASLSTHMLSNHCPDIATQCDLCDKRFAYKDTLIIHMKNHHPFQSSEFSQTLEEEPEVNPWDKYELSLESNQIKEHMEEHSTTAFSCEICELAFLTIEMLNTHTEEYHTNERAQCDVCNTNLTSTEDLSTHVCDTSLKLCLECTKQIKESDKHTVTCSKCLACYHKKCRELRSATGRSC